MDIGATDEQIEDAVAVFGTAFDYSVSEALIDVSQRGNLWVKNKCTSV